VNNKCLMKQIGIFFFANLLYGCAGHTVHSSQVVDDDKLTIHAQNASLPDYRFVSAEQEHMYKILLAEIAGQRGNYILSAEIYYDVAERTRDVQLAERATKIAAFIENYQLAGRAASLWLDIDPDNKSARQILSSVLLEQQRSDEAIQQLSQVLKTLSTQNDKAAHQEVNILVELLSRHKEQGLQLAKKLTEKFPDDLMALYIYARLQLANEQLGESLTTLDKIIAKDPRYPNVVLLYTHILEKQNNINTALSFLQQHIKQHPEELDWQFIYARMLAGMKKYPKAIDAFKALLDKDHKQRDDILFAIAALYLQTEQYNDAKIYFQHLTESEQQQNTAYFYLAKIAEQEKNITHAIVQYQKIKQGEHYLGAQTRIAVLMSQQGSLEDALAYLRSVPVESNKETLHLKQVEAELLTEHKHYAQAMLVYDDILKAAPDTVSILYMRALLADKLGQQADVEKDLRRVLSLSPNHVDALNALGYSLANNTTRYQEAHELIKQALAARPKAHYILDSMGWVLYRLGQYDAAIDYLNKAQAALDDPEIAAHLGEVLWVKGDKQQAKDIWEKAQEKFPNDEFLQQVIRRFLP